MTSWRSYCSTYGKPADYVAMPDYTTNGNLGIAFGNFKRGYIIADRIGTRVLRDPFSSKPNVLFYVTKRLGGAVLNSEAIKFLKFA